MTPAHAFAFEATLELQPDTDPRAPGGTVQPDERHLAEGLARPT